MQAYEYFIAMLNKAIDKAGSPSRLARALDIAPNMITRWSKGERCPNLKSIQPVFDYLNEEFRTRELAVDKDVHFVNPRLAKAAERRPWRTTFWPPPSWARWAPAPATSIRSRSSAGCSPT